MQIWPVIHVQGKAHALECAETASIAGCRGVFLISMVGHNDAVDESYRFIRGRFPELPVGVNYLGVDPDVAVRLANGRGYAAAWFDQQVESGATQDAAIGRASNIVLRATDGFPVFAGVAFKGQRPEPFPGLAAKNARELGFVPTTSGIVTGQPPTVEKVEMIRDALGDGVSLAVASGLTPENVGDFKHLITHALVSTGISERDGVFSPAKLAMFVKAAN